MTQWLGGLRCHLAVAWALASAVITSCQTGVKSHPEFWIFCLNKIFAPVSIVDDTEGM